MSETLQDLRAILEGRFQPETLARILGPDPEIPERIPLPDAFVPDEVDLEEAAELFHEWLGAGAYLRALALLKVLGESCGPVPDLLALLSEALQSADPLQSTDPLPREFLGTQRARIAWSVLQRDTLAFSMDVPQGGRQWVVCSSGPLEDERVKDGLTLIWWSTTGVAGTLRPAGTRKVARRKLELSANVVFLGETKVKSGISRVPAEIQDLSDTGAGVRVRDRFGRLAGFDLKGARIRLEVRKPDSKDPLSTLAIIRWVDVSTDEQAGQVCRLGLKFDDPPPEFLSSVQELLSPGKGDVQYLWSLWESDSGKA